MDGSCMEVTFVLLPGGRLLVLCQPEGNDRFFGGKTCVITIEFTQMRRAMVNDGREMVCWKGWKWNHPDDDDDDEGLYTALLWLIAHRASFNVC